MWIVIIIIVIVFAIVLIAFLYLKNDPHYITKFIKENPNRTSIYLINNDKVVLAHNENNLMPLASTVKIIIALEYANQVSKNIISNNELVELSELNKYYLPNTDAGAHKSWLYELEQKNLINNNSVALTEVVKGMIKFSSNASAEYLIDKFGEENINSTIKNQGINQTTIYPFVSSLLLCANFPELIDPDLIAKSWKVHERLKKGDDELIQSFRIPKPAVQKIWSSRLPASTAKDYCNLMNKINTGNLSDRTVANYLKEILAWPLEVNPVNKNYFSSLGMKGGSTAFIVTETLFATDTAGNTIALAIFFNDLADWEKLLIDGHLNKFELKLLLDEKFRNAVEEKISHRHN